MVIDGLLDITADMMGDNEWECMAMNRVTGFNSVTDRISFVVGKHQQQHIISPWGGIRIILL